MKLLKDKIVFITGGSRGIGAAIAKRFAEQGASVGFSFRSNTEAAAQVMAELAAFEGKHRSFQCDIAQAIQVEETMAAFLAEFGGIDILVNNAGVIRDNLACNISPEDWNEVLATNLTAAFLHTQWALKTMIAARKGVIINIGSISGETGNAGQANYAAAKAGLIGFTKSIARETGSRNIRCNLIAPGIIETDMSRNSLPDTEAHLKKSIALRRIGTAEEVADVALFLASDLSRYMTGQVVNVCGGFSH
jgi:3-oxoacyl-[acyl-carrier protein] reductase